MSKKAREYILYDGRACGDQDTDNALLLFACGRGQEGRKDAVESAGSFGAMACYSYAVKGRTLTDKQWEWDWYPKDYGQGPAGFNVVGDWPELPKEVRI